MDNINIEDYAKMENITIINKHSGKVYHDSGERNIDFQLWCKKNLPTNKYYCSDIDGIICDFTIQPGKVLILETKTYMSEPEPFQEKIHKNLSQALALASMFGNNTWNFHGSHLLMFEKTDPTNGRIWLDRELITEAELERKLSTFDFPRYKVEIKNDWVKGDQLWIPTRKNYG